MTSDPPDQSNKRANDRRLVLKGAQIVYGAGGKSTIDCRVRNLSDTGARLEFPTAQLLPHLFELHIKGMPVRYCILRWAKDNLAGVFFVTSEIEE
jgi:hypothetical protein